MCLELILAVLLMSSPPPAQMGNVESARGALGQQENPQEPAAEPPVSGADAKQSDSKQQETAPQDKSVEPSSQNASKQPAGSARKRHARSKKSTAQPTTEGEPRKVVIHRGGTSEPIAQILPGMTEEEAARQRENAEQLLMAAESSLEQLAARSLS